MRSPIKVLQINSCNFGSTGNIMLNISKKMHDKGYISYVAYANSRANKKKKIQNSITIGSIIERNLHLKLAYYTGLNGCFSFCGTKKLLRQINELQPDIIHLHNLHNCYINLRMMFNYIKKKKISVVWTLHDCWAFTGQCPHFTLVKCEKWKSGCFNCAQHSKYPESRVDITQVMYSLKRKWFTGIKNLTIVTPSQWLADRVAESFLDCYPIKVINNGIDLSIFKPTTSDFRERHELQNKKILLGVASVWNKSKGLDIFIELSKILSDDNKIVLVGLSMEQCMSMPSNILGFQNTKNTKELAEIYSAADWFINPSMEETMGLVTVEALACGTPAIVSNSTAVPETIYSNCGFVVENCNADDFAKAIGEINQSFKQHDCLKRAKDFDMQVKCNEYINIYEGLVGNDKTL